MSVLKKLMQARVALQKRKLSKSGHNPFAGYRYFELGDFLPAVQEIFLELGLCGIVSFEGGEAILRIYDTDDPSSEPIVFRSPMGSASLRGCHEVQNIGAVETYQRRYLWVTAMEIVENDILDATTGKDQKNQTKSVHPLDDVFEHCTEQELKDAKEAADFIVEAYNSGNMEAAYEQYAYMRDVYTPEHGEAAILAMWKYLQPHSKIRSALKRMANERQQQGPGSGDQKTA